LRRQLHPPSFKRGERRRGHSHALRGGPELTGNRKEKKNSVFYEGTFLFQPLAGKGKKGGLGRFTIDKGKTSKEKDGNKYHEIPQQREADKF